MGDLLDSQDLKGLKLRRQKKYDADLSSTHGSIVPLGIKTCSKVSTYTDFAKSYHKKSGSTPLDFKVSEALFLKKLGFFEYFW